MRRGEKRRLGIAGEAQAHRHGAVRRELGDHEAGELWQGLQFFLDWRGGGGARYRVRAFRRVAGAQWSAGSRLQLCGKSATLLASFVLGADKSALDLQVAVVIDADEDSGAGGLDRVIDRRTLVELFDLRLELGHALIGLLRKLVDAFVLLRETTIFGDGGVVAGLLLFRHRRLGPRQSSQAIGVAVGKVDRSLRPLPTLGADFRSGLFEPLAREPIEQRCILQPSPVVAVEEITQHDAACALISLDADELSALVGGPDRALRQLAADRVGSFVVGSRQGLPDLLCRAGDYAEQRWASHCAAWMTSGNCSG